MTEIATGVEKEEIYDDLRQEESDIRDIILEECHARDSEFFADALLSFKARYEGETCPDGSPYWLNRLVQFAKESSYPCKRTMQRIANYYGFRVTAWI